MTIFTEANIIDTYTARQALEDGQLIDVCARLGQNLAAEIGLRIPLYFTAGVWADLVKVPECAPWQDEVGRARKIYLNEYWIDKYEVSVEAYSQCVDSGFCLRPALVNSHVRDPYNWGVAYKYNNPINGVSWGQAASYCKWRGKRLPTEAEWEKAARGVNGQLYPWGGNYPSEDQYGNFSDKTRVTRMNHSEFPSVSDYNDGFKATAPVGSFPKGVSPYGAYDVAGNVREWVGDWYGKYHVRAPKRNPKGPRVGSRRITRGGGWGSVEGDLRAYTRHVVAPSEASADIGFRCVVSSG